MSLIKPEESRKLKQIKLSTKIEIVEKKIPTGEEIIKAQVEGVFEKLFTEHEELFTFDDSLIPDLSAFSKEELVHQLLQLQLRDLALSTKTNKIWQTKNYLTTEMTEAGEEIVTVIEEEEETETEEIEAKDVRTETEEEKEVENQNAETKT